MGAILQLRDRLVNLMSGQGGANDQRSYAFHVLQRLNPQQIEASYRSSWLMRNAVDIPAYDMTRAWRDWQADKQQIETIEAEERRLGLREKVRRALILGRLGGGAIILGLRDGRPSEPLPVQVRPNDLAYLHVVSRHRLNLGEIIRDPASPFCGEPVRFEMQAAGANAYIHPSRVIPFRGLQVPDMGTTTEHDWYWGDPIAQAIQDAVDDADTARSGFASLIGKARQDIVRMPNLMQNAATAEYEQRFMERMRLAGLGASTHNMLVLDKEEEWDQRQVNWTGMPEIIRTYLAIVAGATQIPATRLLGKAPEGMNATGEGDERNYNTMVEGKQENDLRPLLDRVDAVMLPSLGIADPDVGYSFAPLSVLSEKERADIGKTKAETVAIYARENLVPGVALEKGVQNMLVEDGLLPGLDGALAELPEDERFPSLGEPDEGEEELELPPVVRGGGETALRRAANDATVRVMDAIDISAEHRPAIEAAMLALAREVGDRPGLPFEDGNSRHYGKGAKGGQFAPRSGGDDADPADLLAFLTEALAGRRRGKRIRLRSPSPHQVAAARTAGADIRGFSRTMRADEVAHVRRQHGSAAREASRGQKPIGKADLARITDITEQAHRIELKGEPGSGKPQRLVYHATVGEDRYEYVETIHPRERTVALRSLLKR